jgi:hypothetical protein
VIYSPNLLNVMGTNIAKDLLTDNHKSSEQKLWRHVILHAFEDAKIETSDRKSSVYKWDAHKWLLGKDDNFESVCWWSGWDPEEVTSRYKKGINNSKITFNQRQVSWIKYTKLFHKYKKSKDKESRKYLLKQVDSARKNVFHATTALVQTVFIYSLING